MIENNSRLHHRDFLVQQRNRFTRGPRLPHLEREDTSMKNGLLKSVVLGFAVAGALSVSVASADVNVTVNPADTWNGFMNVFELPSNGGGYVFGSGWGPADLCAVFTGNNLRLSPNTIGDPNPFWYTPSGGPGSTGNKVMEGNMYVEPAGSLPGQLVTFSGDVISHDLLPSHTASVFVRDFAPDFSSVNEVFVPIPTSGSFSISLNTINDPARHVQYGFQIKGPCVWVTDVGPYGGVVVGPTQTTPAAPATWGRIKAQYK
jgi:hypothetical protein